MVGHCFRCKKEMTTYHSWLKKGKGRYCSRTCSQTLFKSGPEENHPRWRGDKAGYHALHKWVQKHRGRPRMCEDCGSTEAKRYEWANISKEYKRELDDWKRLCVSCHLVFDDHSAKLTQTWKEKKWKTVNG